jgi:ribosomal protein S17E
MGRVRGKTVRKYTLEVLKKDRGGFSSNYDANKIELNKIIVASKTIRNKIAGFITKLAKDKKIEGYIIEHSAK